MRRIVYGEKRVVATRLHSSFHSMLEEERKKISQHVGRPVTITQISELLAGHPKFKFPEVGKEVADLVYKKKGRRF